jgi:hypothetical protein
MNVSTDSNITLSGMMREYKYGKRAIFYEWVTDFINHTGNILAQRKLYETNRSKGIHIFSIIFSLLSYSIRKDKCMISPCPCVCP